MICSAELQHKHTVHTVQGQWKEVLTHVHNH